MPSPPITSTQHTTHQAQHQSDGDLPRANENPSLHAQDHKVSSTNIDHYSEPTSPHHPDPAIATPDREWKAGKEEWLIILVIAIVSLMVALDATILVPVLPVGVRREQAVERDLTILGYRQRSEW